METNPKSIFEWARRQRELLRLERDEEQSQVADAIAQLSAQECMERGMSLLPLEVKGLSTGLYGRACVSVANPKDRPLPAHRFSAGDEVRLYSSKGSKSGAPDEGPSEITGIVGKVTERTVEVLSDDADNAGSLRPPLRLDVVASVATHKKLMLGLDALEKYPGGGPAERLINVLFGVEPPSTVAPSTAVLAVASRAGGAPSAVSRLNGSQRDAVEFALATRDVALIHGPPGTGKTTTVVALVLEAVARGWRCLVCAPSNVAVDGILERLVAEGRNSDGRANGRPRVRVVRMGHPARLLPQVVEYSLEAIILQHEGTAIVKDVRGEIDALVRRLYPAVNGSGGKSRERLRPGGRKSAREELKSLRKEARARENRVVQEVLKSRDVVLATCVGAAMHSLRDEEFDLVVIDEAAQALEAACWIPILKGKRLVLAGDHKQLAPTVKSRKAAEGGKLDPLAPVEPSDSADGVGGSGGDGLGLTMFDRVLRDIGSGVCRMLDVQYRMNRDICDWASTEMYGGLLRADPSVAERTLPGLPHASKAHDMASAVMLLLDTSGCNMHEEETGGGSRRNEREAEVAVRHVKNLLEAGLLKTEVAVISPYNGQVNLLKSLLHPEHNGVEVRSVDGFQGGEKEAIVLSLVRSNEGRRVGFLADARRLNVAVTRAKRHVAVVCDAECCGSDAFIGRLLRYIEEKGEHRSALELVDTGAFDASTSAQEASSIIEKGGRRDADDRNVKGGRRSPDSFHQVDTTRISDEDVFALVETFSRENRPDAAPSGSSSGRDGGEVVEVSRLELPVELTPRQRALVHEMAEGLGLGHASKGESANRILVLSSRNQPAAAEAAKAKGKAARECSNVTSENIEEKATELKQSAVAVAGKNGDYGPFEATMLRARDFQRFPFPGSVEADDKSREPRLGALSGSIHVESAAVHPPYPAGVGTSASTPAAPKSPGAIQGGSNALLASLHAERSARRGPPVPYPATKSNKRGGEREDASSTLDDRGFTVDIAGATLGSGGGIASGASKKNTSSRRGASGKKGRQKKPGGAGTQKTSVVGGSTVRDSNGDDDDEMAFLDAQIKTQRDSEPCYASLLRSTTAAMREKNPAWAAAEDKGKPSRSEITRARRTQLQGALQARLAQDEKRRGKASGRGEESK